jgi:hypothetical protein
MGPSGVVSEGPVGPVALFFTYTSTHDDPATGDRQNPIHDAGNVADGYAQCNVIGLTNQADLTAVDNTGTATRTKKPGKSLQAYEAIGGHGGIDYDILLLKMDGAGTDDMPYVESGVEYGHGSERDAHRFEVMRNDDGMLEFSGEPNVPVGRYTFRLHANDQAGELAGLDNQLKYVEWPVMISTRGAGRTANSTTEPETSITNDTPNFILEKDDEDPVYFADGDAKLAGIPKLNLAPDAVQAYAGFVGDGDEDILWLGRMSPDWTLNWKIQGTEGSDSVAINNSVWAALHRYGSDGQPNISSDGATDQRFDDSAKTSCDEYYIKVGGEVGGYRLTWMVTTN